MVDYKAFPIQNTILSGNIQGTLNRLLEMQQTSGLKFIDTTIMTPSHIVDEMLDALPKEIWNSKTRFLNIACKDGIYLVKIFERLFKALEKFEPDETKRAWHILENQLYAICIDNTVGKMLNTLIYGMNEKGKEHITWFNTLKDLQKLKQVEIKQYIYKRFLDTGKIDKKETVKYMNFDVVIGNPPYNNDTYLDFVTLSKELITHKTGVEREITIIRNRWHSLFNHPSQMAS